MEMMIPKKRVSSGNWLRLRLELGFYLQPDFSVPNAQDQRQEEDQWNSDKLLPPTAGS
jgi:hypothetical protein